MGTLDQQMKDSERLEQLARKYVEYVPVYLRLGLMSYVSFSLSVCLCGCVCAQILQAIRPS